MTVTDTGTVLITGPTRRTGQNLPLAGPGSVRESPGMLRRARSPSSQVWGTV